MSGIGRRMNNLKSILKVRTGPGAAVLPPAVTKIHLEFAHKWDEGHYGGRKFWHEILPPLKYHNPSIPMIVNRTRDQKAPATLRIYLRDDSSSSSSSSSSPSQDPLLEAPSSSTSIPKKAVATVDAWTHIASSTEGTAPPPEPAEGETVVKINMKNVRLDDILKQFLETTGARSVEPTPEDQAEVDRLAELEARAVIDREEQRRYREKLKSEKMMLDRARKEVNALKSD